VDTELFEALAKKKVLSEEMRSARTFCLQHAGNLHEEAYSKEPEQLLYLVILCSQLRDLEQKRSQQP
jgi:hypothetical protein